MPEKTNKGLSLAAAYNNAANAIKEAILNAQYEAARGVNNIQLVLYYGIGRICRTIPGKGNGGQMPSGLSVRC